MSEHLTHHHKKHASRRETAKKAIPLFKDLLPESSHAITTISARDIFELLDGYTKTYRLPLGSCSCEDVDTDFSAGHFLEKIDTLGTFYKDQTETLEDHADVFAEVTDTEPTAYIRGYSLYTIIMARRKDTIFTRWPVSAEAMRLGAHDKQDPYGLARLVSAHTEREQPYLFDCVGTRLGNLLCGIDYSHPSEIFSIVNNRRMLTLGIGMASMQLEQFYYESMGDDMRSLVPAV
jgi:hypothetical protein